MTPIGLKELPQKLNLGCGRRRIADALNVDIDREVEPDLEYDLDRPVAISSLPFYRGFCIRCDRALRKRSGSDGGDSSRHSRRCSSSDNSAPFFMCKRFHRSNASAFLWDFKLQLRNLIRRLYALYEGPVSIPCAQSYLLSTSAQPPGAAHGQSVARALRATLDMALSCLVHLFRAGGCQRLADGKRVIRLCDDPASYP
jgi:hypothetical protein